MLTANGGPRDPQQVALAIYCASARDTRSSEQHMAQGLLRHCHVSAGMCATSLPAFLPRRTRLADPMNQGRAVVCILDSIHKVGCCDRRIKAHAPSCSGSHGRRSSSHTTSGFGGTTCAQICTNRWIGPDSLAGSHRVQNHTDIGSSHSRTRSSSDKLPNKLRTLKSVSTKRGRRSAKRRSHKTTSINCVTSYLVGILALLWSCLILQIWNLLNHWGVAGAAAGTRTCRHISPPLHRSLRSRVQILLPLQAGRRPRDCPTSKTVSPITQYSRPGPKSGVGRSLIALIILIRCQLSHGVRVPTLSVGVGEGNPLPKLNGIQVSYGKQEPTHDWNRYAKRSFKRACQRAIKHRHASYKGRTLTVKDTLAQQPSPSLRKSPKPDQSQRRLQVYCHMWVAWARECTRTSWGFYRSVSLRHSACARNQAQGGQRARDPKLDLRWLGH